MDVLLGTRPPFSDYIGRVESMAVIGLEAVI